MKALFIYYTGTYNTRYLTDMVEREFIAKGYDTARVEITCDTPSVSTDGYDIIGFSYPIYGFNSPLPFNKYIRKLRFNKGQKFFIYKNSGETLAMNNASSRILLRIMKRQGADFKGEYHFGVGCWWVFLVMGLMSIVGSVMVHDIFFSTLLAVWGASSLWSIGELFHQRKRVERGWFPANPKRQRKA